MTRIVALALLSLFSLTPAVAQQQKVPVDDLTPGFKVPEQESDYIRRTVMIPMRDGVKLYTVIVASKGAKDAPILLTRTCYNAAARRW
jgi:predicted acyl esterase